jgi:hypothetical protein
VKTAKSVTIAMFAGVALAIAGSVHAGSSSSAGGALSAHAANYAVRNGGMGNRAGMRAGNRRFFGAYQYPYYPYGYGYGYGNQIILNPDEADWAEQWGSLYQDNQGPYARAAAKGNPTGPARIWEIPDK